MAAFIPSRRDPEEETEHALAKVREDKVREAADGFDGTRVAHLDLVPVATEVFDGVLGERPNQMERRRDEVSVSASDLDRPPGRGRRRRGGAAPERQRRDPLHRVVAPRGRRGSDRQPDGGRGDGGDLTVKQVWQWVHAGRFTLEQVRAVMAEETPEGGRFAEAHEIFERVALSDDFVEFLTLPAYEYID